MLNNTKIEKLINDLIQAVNSAGKEDFGKIKDDQLGRLYFTTESLIAAFDNFIDKIDAEIINRGEIVIPELGQKIMKEDEPVLKIKKLSKTEIKAAETKQAEASKAAKNPAAKKPAAAVKKPAAKKPAAPKK